MRSNFLRKIGFFTGILLAGVFLFVFTGSLRFRTLPADTTSHLPDSLYQFKGIFHVRTAWSDGVIDPDTLKTLATGLDFLLLTEKNSLDARLSGQTGVYNGLTVLPDIEVSLPGDSGLFAAFNFSDLSGVSPGDRFNDFRPDENPFRSSFKVSLYHGHPEKNFTWPMTQIQGAELICFESGWADGGNPVHSVLTFLLSDYFPWLLNPYIGLRDPSGLLSEENPVVLFGGPGAVDPKKLAGIFPYQFPSYPSVLRTSVLHLMTEETLISSASHNQQVIYPALRNGQFFVANDLLSPADGFASWFTIRGKSYTSRNLFAEPDSAIWSLYIPETESGTICLIYENGLRKKVLTGSGLKTIQVSGKKTVRAEIRQIRKPWYSGFLFWKSDEDWAVSWIFTQVYSLGYSEKSTY